MTLLAADTTYALFPFSLETTKISNKLCLVAAAVVLRLWAAAGGQPPQATVTSFSTVTSSSSAGEETRPQSTYQTHSSGESDLINTYLLTEYRNPIEGLNKLCFLTC